MSEPIIVAPQPLGYIQVGLNAKGEPVCEIKVYAQTPEQMIVDLNKIVDALPTTFSNMTKARFGLASSKLQ